MMRRPPLRLAALAAAATAGVLAAGPPAAAPAQTAGVPCNADVSLLGFSDALDGTSYGGLPIGGLTGAAYEPRAGELHVLAGGAPARTFTLRVGPAAEPTPVDVTVLRDAADEPLPDARGGLALLRRGDLLVPGPGSVRRFGRAGTLLGEVALPARFAPWQPAAVTVSPDEDRLFALPARTLPGDESRFGNPIQYVRLARLDAAWPRTFRARAQHAYWTTDQHVVADAVALSRRRLLVLETGSYGARGFGALDVHLYLVDLRRARDVTREPSIALGELEDEAVLAKRLVVDLWTCPGGITVPEPGGRPIPDDHQGLALGPRLPGGRRVVNLVSDDTSDPPRYVTRVLALAIDEAALRAPVP